MADNKNVTMGQLVDFAKKADKRLDDLEMVKMGSMNLVISASGWTNDSGDENFPHRYVMTVDGVTAASRADAVLDDASIKVASVSGVCAVSETAANSVIFKSRTAPTSDLTGTLYVYKQVVENA